LTLYTKAYAQKLLKSLSLSLTDLVSPLSEYFLSADSETCSSNNMKLIIRRPNSPRFPVNTTMLFAFSFQKPQPLVLVRAVRSEHFISSHIDVIVEVCCVVFSSSSFRFCGPSNRMSLPDTFVEGFHDAAAVKRMAYTEFGNTGLKVSKLSLGGGTLSHFYG
jgi:hypothetical protein